MTLIRLHFMGAVKNLGLEVGRRLADKVRNPLVKTLTSSLCPKQQRKVCCTIDSLPYLTRCGRWCLNLNSGYMPTSLSCLKS